MVIISARPSYCDNSIILHLREIEGESIVLSLKDQAKNLKSIDEVNAIEEPMEKDIIVIDFEPFDVHVYVLE